MFCSDKRSWQLYKSKRTSMRIKEKLIQFCFLINAFQSLAFIGLFIGIIPFAMINPAIPEKIFSLFQNKTFGIIYTSLTLCSFINWLYCLRFWYKYDRYSKAIFLLIFPHVLYAPFYYYQVKIKKRPLKNKIKNEPVVLGRTIQLKEYENNADIETDLKNI